MRDAFQFEPWIVLPFTRPVYDVDAAVKLGCSDSAAIRYLLTCAGQRRPVLEVAEIGALTRYDRPMPCLRGYDRLLEQDQEVAP